MSQDWRSFLSVLEERGEVVRISDPVSRDYEISTLMMDLEKEASYPLVIFENVVGGAFPVITNALAPRKRLALAMGTQPTELAQEYSRKIQLRPGAVLLKEASFEANFVSGEDIDLTKFPILTHFPIDAWPLCHVRPVRRQRSGDRSRDPRVSPHAVEGQIQAGYQFSFPPASVGIFSAVRREG